MSLQHSHETPALDDSPRNCHGHVALLAESHSLEQWHWRALERDATPIAYVVGGLATPLKNMSSSIGMMTFPIYAKSKNVPNHQPVVDLDYVLNGINVISMEHAHEFKQNQPRKSLRLWGMNQMRSWSAMTCCA